MEYFSGNMDILSEGPWQPSPLDQPFDSLIESFDEASAPYDALEYQNLNIDSLCFPLVPESVDSKVQNDITSEIAADESAQSQPPTPVKSKDDSVEPVQSCLEGSDLPDSLGGCVGFDESGDWSYPSLFMADNNAGRAFEDMAFPILTLAPSGDTRQHGKQRQPVHKYSDRKWHSGPTYQEVTRAALTRRRLNRVSSSQGADLPMQQPSLMAASSGHEASAFDGALVPSTSMFFGSEQQQGVSARFPIACLASSSGFDVNQVVGLGAEFTDPNPGVAISSPWADLQTVGSGEPQDAVDWDLPSKRSMHLGSEHSCCQPLEVDPVGFGCYGLLRTKPLAKARRTKSPGKCAQTKAKTLAVKKGGGSKAGKVHATKQTQQFNDWSTQGFVPDILQPKVSPWQIAMMRQYHERVCMPVQPNANLPQQQVSSPDLGDLIFNEIRRQINDQLLSTGF